MKKRVLSLVLCLVMVFSLFPLSAMASVYRINEGSDPSSAPKVVFKNGESEISTQYISDAAATVYDPGVPAVDEHQTFHGWFLEPDFSGDAMTIEDVNAYVHANYAAIKSAGSLNVYAKVVDTYYVTYVASEKVSESSPEQNIVQKVDAVDVPVGTTSYSYDVDASYNPLGADQKFDGWVYDGHTYQMGDTVDVSPAADITLTADVANGYWVSFAENDDPSVNTKLSEDIHASYQAPVFVEGSGTLNLDSYSVTASGYTFAGWYDAPVDGNRVHTATAGTTVYAHWTMNSRADYTVIIWKQNVDGESYDFEESIKLSGNSGSTINSVTSQGSGDGRYARVDGSDKRYTGFHLKEYDTGKTIAPQGSTVVNVYYDRNEHTLTFKSGSTTYKTITALYGQFIGDNFPITTGTGDRWEPPYGCKSFNKVLVYIPYMVDETITFTRDTATFLTKTMYYYVEVLPGETGTTTFNGKSFKLLGKPVTAKYRYFTKSEDFVDMSASGFDQFGSNPSFGNGTQVYADSNNEIKFYYSRHSYSITFMDGSYVNSRGEKVRTDNQGTFKTVSSIPFESNIAAYNQGGASYYDPTGDSSIDGFLFAGWYKDPDCKEAYTFDKMPSNNVTVYAKWIPIEYRVNLELNGGSGIGTNFKVDYRGTVDITKNPEKEGYVLVGWYTDEACTHRFNLSTQLNDDTITEPDYREEANPTVQGKLTLYAKWRSVLGEPGYINVVYDADGKGVAPEDNNKYADQTPTSVAFAPHDVTSGYVFEYWVLQDKNGNDIGHFYPGQRFTVDVNNAVYDAAVPSYTVTLKAVYCDETDDTTFLKYDLNGGGTFTDSGEGTKTVQTIMINGVQTLLGAADITTTKLFLGWNQVKEQAEAGVVEFEGGEKVGVDKLDDPANTLYAVYAANNAFVIDFNAKMKLATDVTDFTVIRDQNGKFDNSSETVTYQLNTGKLSDAAGKTKATALELISFSGADQANAFGKVVGADENAAAAWMQLTAIPASNIYIDDDLRGATLDAGDGFGFNDDVTGVATDTNSRSAARVDENGKQVYWLSFTGTGLDIYCTTDTKGGYVTAGVFGADGNVIKEQTQTIRNYSEKEHFNVPTVSFSGLDYGTYKVKLTALADSWYRLDGVRVYGAMADNEAVYTNNGAADHANADYANLRKLLLNDGTPFNFGEQSDMLAKKGVLYLDSVVVPGENGVPPYEGAQSVYEKNGPKNEIYLDKNQGIVFTVDGYADLVKDNKNPNMAFYVGLSVAKDSTTARLSDGDKVTTPTISSVVDQYYKITPNEDGTCAIVNTGSGILAVTDIQITGVTTKTEIGGTVDNYEVPVTLNLVVNNKTVDYAAKFMTLQESAAVDEPTVDPAQAIRDMIKELISSFVAQLFSSISRLFGN